MNKWIKIAGIVALALLAWWLWSFKLEPPIQPIVEKPSTKTLPLQPTPIKSDPLPVASEEYLQMTGGRSSNLEDPRWAKKRVLDKVDPKWQGRVKIEFYGRVVDQFGTPVEGAMAAFTWTDLSQNGSSAAQTLSNSTGLFQLEGIRGKHLNVRVSKKGYQPFEENRPSFEYAGFWEENFHEPDAKNPVIFKLWKKSEAEPLAHREGEITVGIGKVGTVHLDSSTQVQVELITNGELREKNWSSKLRMVGGEIQLTTDEFPFKAPESGYNGELSLDLKTPKPANWGGLYQGGLFYVKTANGHYGRIELKTIPGKAFMRYSWFLNPSGSQNLEYDPAKQIK